uniref:Leucine-rich repeat protein SHOC-2 n=1 Tax=Knipowitschia caucasica TaxID=637954 RepID=A0AAV2JMF9_KNICA
MLFPVEEAASDLQLRLCVGDGLDTERPPHGSDSDEPKELSLHQPPDCLCLKRRQLQRVPEDLLKNRALRALKCLYLEGNELQSVPPALFTSLPNLEWLDLRHNHIPALPADIGRHRCLRTLLLEGNPIEELPLELGNVLSLSGLNLRDCPLRFPPTDVLHRGVYGILQFLRTALAQRPVSAPMRPPGDRAFPMCTAQPRLRLPPLKRTSIHPSASRVRDRAHKNSSLVPRCPSARLTSVTMATARIVARLVAPAAGP